MRLQYRRLFFYTYLGVFFTIAPLVVFYTAGYRYQWTTGLLVHTGAIAISSTPKGAAVTLDQKQTNKHTPSFFKRILPGIYHVQLSKEGYKPWERDIHVSSRQTTVIENASLFLDVLPVQKIQAPMAVTAASPDGSILAYGTIVEPWFELWLYNIKEDRYALLDRLPASEPFLTDLRWNKDGSLLLLGPRLAYTTTGPTNDQLEQDETMIEMNGTTFALSKTMEGVLVMQEENKTQTTVAVLPVGTYRFVETQNALILLQDPLRNRLILIDTQTNGPPILFNVSATVYAWNGNTFYYSDGLELHRYHISGNNDDLITRSSEPIQAIIPFPKEQTIILVYETSVIARDVSDLGQPVNTVLVTADYIRTFWIDQRGRTGYVVGSLHETEGLFSLALTK